MQKYDYININNLFKNSGGFKMKNYVIYDDTYLGPGSLIVCKEKNKIIKFLKIFIMNNYGFPNYGLRAFSIFGKDNPDNEFTVIDFVFTDEDTENNLYKVFHSLYKDLNGKKIETIDKFYQGRNSFSLREENNTITLSISKDIYGVKDATDFIDINIGDEVTCESYQTIEQFYNQLLNSNNAKTEDINQLVLSHIK